MTGRDVRPEVVVFATGYTQEMNWLGPDYPKPIDADVRGVIKRDDPTVGFIGFMRPGIGAIPAVSEQQAMLWTLLLLKKIGVPTSPSHYHLLFDTSARIKYGVDFG